MEIEYFFLLLAVITYFLGKFVGKLEYDYKNTINPAKINNVDITISKINNNYLVHGRHSNEFIIQGSTKEELLEKLAIRFPFTNFMVDTDNMKEIGFIE
jgi:hypothetical protein